MTGKMSGTPETATPETATPKTETPETEEGSLLSGFLQLNYKISCEPTSRYLDTKLALEKERSYKTHCCFAYITIAKS
jgi:hypothetical protein